MKTRSITLGAAALALVAGTLTACTTGGNGSPNVDTASCANDIPKSGVPLVTIWAWYGGFEKVADDFNDKHDDVQVCWTGSSSGAEAYTKLNTTIEAGTGAPDIAMLEGDVIPGYVLQGALVDLTEHGASEVEDDYVPGFWKTVSVGEGVYGIPVDGGPMGLIYRQDIFDQYGLTMPTTWEEFATTAQALKDAGSPGVLTDFPTNGRAFNQAMFAQAGAEFFEYDSAEPETIGITLDNEPSLQVMEYWKNLVDRGLVAADDAFTSDYNTKLATGGYAVYIAAAWGGGYLTSIAEHDPDAQWRVAPLPQWDPENPVAGNWGGSVFAVTAQSSQPELASQVAMELYGNDDAWKIAIEEANVFPVWLPMLESEYFANIESAMFGGQQINKDVFLQAAAEYEGVTASPFQNFVYDKQTEELAAVMNGEKAPAEALASLQATVVEYAEQQGFTVK